MAEIPAPMSPERLAEIREWARRGWDPVAMRRKLNSAITHRWELLRELDRLAAPPETSPTGPVDSYEEGRAAVRDDVASILDLIDAGREQEADHDAAPQPLRRAFWPPQPGDIWLGDLSMNIPKAWTCIRPGLLTGAGDWGAETAWNRFGPLRLACRDGRIITDEKED